MYKYIYILICLLGVALGASAQGYRYQNVIQGPRGHLANVPVAVCSQPATISSAPCSPLATLYTDSTDTVACNGTNGCSNPLTSDGYGNVLFYAAPGKYTIQYYGPQFSAPIAYQDIVLPCDPSNCSLTGTVTLPGLILNGSTITASEPVQAGTINSIFTMDGVTYPFTSAGLVSCVAAANAVNSGAGGVCDARGMQGTATLTSALTVGTGSGNKTQLLLGPLTLTTSAAITIQQNSSIVGLPQSNSDATSNPATTIIQANATNLSCIVNFAGNLAVMQDVLVDGNKANNTTTTDDGICINNARATLTRVTSQHNKRYGIHIISTGTTNQSQVAKITQSMSQFNDNSGLRCEATTDVLIDTKSEFENNGGWGIDDFDCSGMHIEDSDISGGTSGGLKIQGISTGWKAVQNIVQGDSFGNNAGPDIFVEGSCSDSSSTLCSRGNIINGNRFVGLGSGVTPNTFDAMKVQDSGSNAITGNVCASQAPQSYKYCLEILQPNRTEGLDTVTGNNIDATNSFGTGYFFPQAGTMCAANNDPANLCSFRIPAGYQADLAQNGIPTNPASGFDRLNFDGSDVFGPITTAGAFTRSKWSGLIATGTATLTGTGACATLSSQNGGSWDGEVTCTGTTGASTLVITPGTTAPNHWECSGSDVTSGHELALPQSGLSATTCTLKASSVTANDVLSFRAVAH